ncbi:MAG: glycosyltransferase [Phycisphaerales bacterium]|nr:glycosyltransferase [Phycisphaerales bacterium]MDG1977415.1 glycosyltransferase [Phycisphaerales bacterium]
MKDEVTVVIPARDAAATLEACLDSLLVILARPESGLARIVLVDDGSRDETPAIARARGVEVLQSGGRGAGAARNAGIAAASTELVWFVDADCVAFPDALDHLRPHLEDPAVAAAGGTYAIAAEATLLERLIHEEIQVRHDRMPDDVDFLATFDVVYRRSVLDAVGGFDERYLKGQDADLAFRVVEAGHRLRFDRRSRVRHHHADRLLRYLRVQRQQGYWRVALHLEHPGRGGNAYSGPIDHLQPFVAAAFVPSLLAIAWPPWGAVVPATMLLVLVLMQLPMTRAMVRRGGWSMAWFVPLGTIRAIWRAIGLVQGVLDRLLRRGAIGSGGIRT